MSRLIFTLCFAVTVLVGLALNGCLTENKQEALRITSQPVSASVNIGDSVTFKVAVVGAGPLTYTWVMLKSLKTDTIVWATTGIFGQRITSYDGALGVQVTIQNATDTVTSAMALLTITYGQGDSLTLGAQGNAAFGSVIDLDSGKVWSSVTANANQSQIDLVYMYYDSSATLNGAAAARDSGIKYSIAPANSYDSLQLRDIQMVRVVSKPNSLRAAEELYLFGDKVRASKIAAGDKFVVFSTEQVYHYLEVRSVSGTDSGAANLTFFIGQIPNV
jgi:hypothetical protein